MWILVRIWVQTVGPSVVGARVPLLKKYLVFVGDMEVNGTGVFMFCFFVGLAICLSIRNRRKLRRTSINLPITQILAVSKEIKEVRVEQLSSSNFVACNGILLTIHDKNSDNDSEKVMLHLGLGKSRHGDSNSHSGSFHHADKDASSQSGEDGASGTFGVCRPSSSYPITAPSPFVGLPEFSHLGWGHWFTLRDLELATNRFSKENVLGEGSYGAVYHGHLINGTPVAVMKLLNNVGQAEKEFRVEVEAISHVRHKNLVRLLGYCGGYSKCRRLCSPPSSPVALALPSRVHRIPPQTLANSS